MSDTTEPQRFFVVHMMKTGGTTLRDRLGHHFGPEGVYPNRTDGPHIFKAVLSVDYLRDRWTARGDEIRVVAGHFPLCVAGLLGVPFTTLTVLREPVERTLSFLRHHRERTPADRHKSLEQIYAEPLRFHGQAHNHMTKMLSMTVDELDDGMLAKVEYTPERLDRAKAALRGLDLVGVQEDLEPFFAELGRRFRLDLGPPLHVNTSTPVDVSDDFRARIAEDNWSDVALYHYAASSVATR